LVNLPVGLIGMAMAIIFVTESRQEGQGKHYFDWWGALSLGGMLSSLVLVLDQGQTWGWTSVASLICYFLIVALLWVFIAIEHHVPEPIVDLKFFKIPAFVNTLTNNFIVFMGMMGGVFLIPIFAQTFLGDTATQSGYLFMPMAAALMCAAPLGGALIGKVQARYVIFASTIVAGIGLYFFSFLDARSTAWSIMWPLSIMAFGLGFGMAQRTNIIASVVDQHEIGIASSILALARNVAGAFGIALFGTLLNNRINVNIMRINALSWVHSHAPADVATYIALVLSKAQIDAYNYVFVVSSIIVILGAFTILTLKVGRERTDVKVHVE
jgi:Na+/melibiose symporter-like transporter